MNPISYTIVLASAVLLAAACASNSGKTDPTPQAKNANAAEQARQFIAEHEARVRPLEVAVQRTAWDANITGKDEDYQKNIDAKNALDAVLADAARFKKLEDIRKSLTSVNMSAEQAQLARQIELLHLQYLEKQVDPELLKAMAAKSSAAEQAFNIYRAKVDGKELTASQVSKVLKESKDSAYRKRVWEASKAVGAAVQPDLKQIVLLRNQAAKKLGFSDYYDMQLQLNELNKAQLLKLMDELDEMTRQPLKQAKAAIDTKLAQDYGIKPEELRPWHYHDPFFQEVPAVQAVDFDTFYAKTDVVKLCRDFYAGIGLPVDDVLKRSDLFEKPGKCPHASCWDIDLEGDVRVLANVVNDEDWAGTMLHELGHAVYSTPYVPLKLPVVLRQPAHSFTTEGVAMMFGRLSKRGDWMAAMGLPVDDVKAVSEAGARAQRDRLLIFAAWTQVMVRFELAMYENPDRDLNTLWWDLVEKYQQLHRPEGRNAPDYAAKFHFVGAPTYYHNYIMGEMFASQLSRAIAKNVQVKDLRAQKDKLLVEINRLNKERGDLKIKTNIEAKTAEHEALLKSVQELEAKIAEARVKVLMLQAQLDNPTKQRAAIEKQKMEMVEQERNRDSLYTAAATEQMTAYADWQKELASGHTDTHPAVKTAKDRVDRAVQALEKRDGEIRAQIEAKVNRIQDLTVKSNVEQAQNDKVQAEALLAHYTQQRQELDQKIKELLPIQYQIQVYTYDINRKRQEYDALAVALYNGHPEVGQFMKQKVFEPGRTMRWDAMVRFATGEELSPKALAEDLK